MNKFLLINIWQNAPGARPQRVHIHELPRCTEEILYAQAWPLSSESVFGLFSFERVKVLQTVRDYIESSLNPGEYLHPSDLAILDWLADPDYLAKRSVRLPEGWYGMEARLLDVIMRNEFKIKCMGCLRYYRPTSLLVVPETHKRGTFHHILDCPEGHRLIAIETVEID